MSLNSAMNAMATPAMVARAEADRQKAQTAREEAAGIANATLATALRDAGEALVGIPADLYGPRPASLARVFTRNDRLRGVGVLLVALGAVGLLLDLMLD